MRRRKLKVFGGTEFYQGHQRRHIVAAYSQREAAEMMKKVCPGFTLYYFKGYWCETGNETELKTATAPGVWVWQGEGNWGDKLLKLP